MKCLSGISVMTIVCPMPMHSPLQMHTRGYRPRYPSHSDCGADRPQSSELVFRLSVVRRGVPDRLGPTRSVVGQRLDPPRTGVARRHRDSEGAIAPFPSAGWMPTFPPRVGSKGSLSRPPRKKCKGGRATMRTKGAAIRSMKMKKGESAL